MMDYEPVELDTLCNVGKPFAAGRDLELGECMFHGLPFRIGADESQCFIGFGGSGSSGPVVIPLGGKAAHTVLVAHALAETHLHEGAHPGRTIGRYRFAYTGGRCEEVLIRERFEIGMVPADWGELAFLCWPDSKDRVTPDRYEGRFGGTGQRQTEAEQAWPRGYYLWQWKNPHPDIPLESLEILPGSGGAGRTETIQRFFVAAVTLGYPDESPLLLPANVPVRITLPRPEDSSPPFGLEVEVDRGTVTYPFALPEAPAEEFLHDSQRGFGESQNPGNSPAYVEVAAVPSATVSVKRAGEMLGSTRWEQLELSRLVEQERVRFELVETGRNWVHTTVLDEDTGNPIPCRIHFRSPNGIPYAPHGHHAHVNSNLGTWHIDVGGDVRLGQISYAYMDGKCQGWLPRGDLIVDVARGFEYEPLRARVEIHPGQRELVLRLKRHEHLNRERYFSGDTHVHFLSTQGALTEAAGEDLDVVNLLLSQWGHLFTNTEEFTGQPVASADGETIVLATQENRQHLLGHLSLLGLKKPVMPWCSDGPSEAELGANLETSLSHWADACHAQGGTVVIPHLPNPNGEPAALIATGRADAVEMLVHSPYFHLEYYRYLNGGYRLPLAGGTDKMDSGVPVGLYRTYAYIPPDEPFTYETWCKALRSGNTFLSGGPLLRFTVNGSAIGDTVHLGRDGGTVELNAEASSIFPIHCLEIVQDGRVVASVEEERGSRRLELKTSLKIERSGWLCARCSGPGYVPVRHHDSWGRGIMAHTSPIYLACGETYEVCSPDTMNYMLTLVDGSLQYIRQRAPQWKHGMTTHHHGEPDHLAFLERPFQEAIQAIHRKMHQHGIPH